MKENKLFTCNFIFLVLGQTSSLFGNMILRFALSMYILEVTGSAAVFGSIMAGSIIPAIILSPFGGILADRANRKNIMVCLDLLSGIVVLCALLTMTEQSSIPVITILLFALSVLGAFESPTVQACVPQMQTGDNVIRANAVVNQIAAVSGLTAPVLGGVFYTAFGLEPVMAVTTACFFLTALLECFIRLEHHKRPRSENLLKMVGRIFESACDFCFMSRGRFCAC